jgi:DNA-3-methyladenine glycosylase
MGAFNPITTKSPLSRDFYARDTETVALELLGKHLLHRCTDRMRIGRIVEV